MCPNTSDSIRRAHIPGTVVVTEDMRSRLRELLLMMLQDIDRTARDNKIEYQLGGGSVLGAVRHGGFIPWDDDIDINITRTECMRLLEAISVQYPDKYSILIPGRTKGYMLLFPQIRLNGTSVRTRDDINNDKCGVCIDIFIIENTYNNPVKRLIHGIGCQFYGYRVSAVKFRRDREFITPFAMSSGDRKLLRKVRNKIRYAALFPCKDMDRLVQRADRWNGKCNDKTSEYVTVPSGRRHFFGEKRPRDVFFPSSAADFEGSAYPCPNDTDRYLSQLYGDYKKIPEDHERESHAFLEPFSLGE